MTRINSLRLGTFVLVYPLDLKIPIWLILINAIAAIVRGIAIVKSLKRKIASREVLILLSGS